MDRGLAAQTQSYRQKRPKDAHRFSSELITHELGEGEGILGWGNGFKLLAQPTPRMKRKT